jgi:putative Flp pilus-assembly TadE/G-like protein
MQAARDDRGQVIVVAALLMTMLLALAGIGVDISWFQFNLIRMQRAADAAALAGVVYLPGNQAGAFNAAYAEATKNGFTNGVGGVTIVPRQDLINNRMLEVTIQGPVQTWFARLLGTSTIQGSRVARAEFVLPVPMGSPQDYYGIATLCRNSDAPTSCPAVGSATGSGTLVTQGFWGAVETKGANRSAGDAYSTYYNPSPTLNAAYAMDGYSYIVELPPGTAGGAVWIFDPLFCATGLRTTAPFQALGLGDYWLSTALTRSVTTEFKLWDMNGTPYSTADDTVIATDGGLFTNMDFADKGTNYKGNGDYGGYGGASSADCQASPYHNAWWRLTSGLAAGQYRLQVVTSSGSTGQNALNNFGIQLTTTAGTGARIYGQSRMCAEMNIASTTALFYLAQVDAAHAGKTLEIRLFDPGDITNTTLRIKQPTATGYTDATFKFTATGSSGGAPISGGPQTSLQTSNSSTNFYNNQWVTIQVALPAGYSAPTPPGETQPGWWKIDYTVGTSGQDVTTWEVSIRGNPVHLVVP